MKPIKTKREIRNEISQQIEEFLQAGGKVNAIPNGVSGNETNTHLFKHASTFSPKQNRTPLNNVIKELDERKKSKPPNKLAKHKKPKKILITDDFGEPLRWIWKD